MYPSDPYFFKVYLRDDPKPPFITDVLDLENEFRSFSDSILIRDVKEMKIAEENFGIDTETFRKINRSLYLSKLDEKDQEESIEGFFQSSNDFVSHFDPKKMPEETSLSSLNYIKERNDKDILNVKSDVQYPIQWDSVENAVKSKDPLTYRLEPFKHYLVTVRIHLPCMHSKIAQGKNNLLIVSHELLLNSEMTLDRLRDRIDCANDYQPIENDVSADPTEPIERFAKEKYQSAMLYIGNTFYIDCRNVQNIDYSEPIRKWGEDKNLDLKNVEIMETTLVKQLRFRLGYPYVFSHLGDCEHLIIFTDARLVNPDDNLLMKCYPLRCNFSAHRGKMCMTCTDKIARFIVTDTERLPMDYNYLCTACFYQYNYIEDRKVDDFKAYKYIDRIAIH